MAVTFKIVCYCIVLTTFCFGFSLGYRKYYIEDECMPSDEKQKIDLKLPASGPDSVGEIRSNRFGTYSRSERNCLIKLSPPEGYGLVLTVLRVDFRDKECRDFVKVLNNDEEGEKLCGYQEFGLNQTYISEEELEILYHTSGTGMGFNKGVQLIFTVTKIDYHGCSSIDEFRCKNSRCIWAGVTCDGINNCGDGSDENIWDYPFCRTYIPPSKKIYSLLATMTPLVVTAAVLGIASIVAVIVGTCICCCKAEISQAEKPILFRNYHDIPNGGYVPLPGYSYGSTGHTLHHMQPVHSQLYPTAPFYRSLANSNIPLVHKKIGRYERPPPYDS